MINLHLKRKIFQANSGVFTAKNNGLYFVNVIFGVTKKMWYVHLRKNGIYVATVQKDYNQGKNYNN